jgi:hypothetical protein
MDDYMANLNDALITVFGEGFVEPYEHMKTPNPQYDVAMSANATRNCS